MEDSRRPLPEAELEEDREFCWGGMGTWGHLSGTEDSGGAGSPHCPLLTLSGTVQRRSTAGGLRAGGGSESWGRSLELCWDDLEDLEDLEGSQGSSGSNSPARRTPPQESCDFWLVLNSIRSAGAPPRPPAGPGCCPPGSSWTSALCCLQGV